MIRKDFLKIFEKAVHITTTDFGETYVIRNISKYLEEIRALHEEGKYDFEEYSKKELYDLKACPVSDKHLDKVAQFEEVFKALYSKEMIEKEILYYNFIEREAVKTGNKKEAKNEKGVLIAPRPKQKFGTDKIIAKIDEFLEHEQEADYFLKKLEAELSRLGISETRKKELIEKRQKFKNNKNIYSLLLQYAAGFGKSNIIGWTTLQLKDLKKNGNYVYDKVMIIVDRIQLRDQIGDKMFNMNVNNKMYVEVRNKIEFLSALSSDTRICIVNIQKFASIKEILTSDVVDKLASLRIAFLIDEIHRSNSGEQHEEMISLFDELQASFDSEKYAKLKRKKNIIVGFTATPSDHTLARFGDYNTYAESEKLWIPFDSYTMKEAIEDGYILNPLRGIIPVSAKMYFEEPENALEGFEGDTGYEEKIPDDEDTGVDAEGKKYAIRKKKIYENEERIKAISKFVVDMLVTTVYPKIRGTAKGMIAVSSIKSAIKYKQAIDEIYKKKVQEKKYQRFENAPIHIVYSSNQDYSSASNLNGGLSEEKVLQNFALAKNGLIIVVDKLQTGFDEPKLHTLFLDKEIRGINAIQTISRVNRTTKYKNDCKIVDFSYKNVNVASIKKAFEHFSNVVVSDFDPLGEEKILGELYKDLLLSAPFENNFEKFQKEMLDAHDEAYKIISIQNSFNSWIKNNPKHAGELKKKINQYFRILNNIENVIEFDKKYNDEVFLEFWRRFNNEYNIVNKSEEIVDDVIIYYDNKIGIIEKKGDNKENDTGDEKKNKAKKGDIEPKQYRFNILDVIKKRNEAEEKIEELIKQFEDKIEKLFEFISLPENGRRLIAKMKDKGSAFSEDEIYRDFDLLYKKYVRRNKSDLGEFFVKETKDLTSKLCDDFEEWIKNKLL
jgi:type I restriction enzyme R subunit